MFGYKNSLNLNFSSNLIMNIITNDSTPRKMWQKLKNLPCYKAMIGSIQGMNKWKSFLDFASDLDLSH